MIRPTRDDRPFRSRVVPAQRASVERIASSTWPDHICVAVNLSPIQFRKNGKLVEQVKSALSAAALSPGRLELEITESVLLADDESAVLVLREFKKLGVRIAPDDFGTGYSSLSHVVRVAPTPQVVGEATRLG